MNFTEAYICNIDRTHELSRRMNKRVYSTAKLPVSFDPRPVATNRVHFPMLDARKKSNVALENRGFFDSQRVFSPGDAAPFNGFMNKVDDESKLRNIIFPMPGLGGSTNRSWTVSAQALIRSQGPGCHSQGSCHPTTRPFWSFGQFR